MNELLREIQDDIRREKLDRLWKNLGKIMVGFSIIVVLATVVSVVVQNHRQAQAMAQTGLFMKGIEKLGAEDYKGAIAVFTELSDDDGSPYYGMAMLRKAQAQNASGDKEGAMKTYQALAAHSSAFGELAEMLANTNNIVVPDKTSPFYYALAEWKGWQLMHDGKKDEAVAQFATLRDDADAPFSLRQRMQEVVGSMNDAAMVR